MSSPCETAGRPRTPPLAPLTSFLRSLLPQLPAGSQRHLPASPASLPRPGPGRAGPSRTVPGRAGPSRAAVSLRVPAHPQHPASRSSGGDRLTCHAWTCSSPLVANVSERGQQELENRAGAGAPGGSTGRVGAEGCLGSQCRLTLSSRRAPQLFCWLFLTPTTLVLSSFHITLKSPPSPHLHLFHSCFPAPLRPVLHIMPGSLLPELSTRLFLALVPLNPESDLVIAVHCAATAPSAPRVEGACYPRQFYGTAPFPKL